MNGLYLRVLETSVISTELRKKDFDKTLTSESIQFLKDRWVICKRLPLPELWWWMEIPIFLKIIWPLVSIFKFLISFLNWFLKREVENKISGKYAINLMYEVSDIEKIDYNSKLLEVFDYGIALLSFLRVQYPFLRFSINVSCGFSKIQHRNIVFIDINKQSDFNLLRLKFYLNHINLMPKTERQINIEYFLIKDVTSKIEYLESWWIMGSWKSKTKFIFI